MIDHVDIWVTNVEGSLAFYSRALKPLSGSSFGHYQSASGPEANAAGIARWDHPPRALTPEGD